MSIQDKAQHQISQLDKEVRTRPTACGFLRKEAFARLQHIRSSRCLMPELSDLLHASLAEEVASVVAYLCYQYLCLGIRVLAA